MTAQVAADLRAAAEVLRRDGWTQSDFHKPPGCHCAMGALAVVSGFHYAIRPSELRQDKCAWGEDEDATDRYETAIKIVEEHLGLSPALALYDWNDTPGRTADEVIAALEVAADAAEATS